MIKLIKSTFYHEKITQKKLAEFITKAKQLSFGKACLKFEHQFGVKQGRSHTVAVNSGSSANLAAIQALLNLGLLKKGDQVGFSAITWSTNVMPLIQLGLVPIPIDVELDTLNVSSKTLSAVLDVAPLKMVFLTNLLGLCDDIDEIASLLRKRNSILVEDNCESLGTVYKGKKLGNFGLMSTFSFYVGHHMSTIEGGAVCTDDEELANELRIVRAHGWDRNLNASTQKKIQSSNNVNSTFYSRYTFYDLGYNLRPTEIMGFLGSVQLKFLDQIIAKRQQNFNRVAEAIATDPRFLKVKTDHLDVHSNFAIPIVCKTKTLRQKLVSRCAGKIEIRPIVGGAMTEQPFFKKYVADATQFSCPNAKFIHENGFYMGNNPELTKQELSKMINTLGKV